MAPSDVSNTIICRASLICGDAICRVRDSKNDCVRRKAVREHGASSFWHEHALIVHRGRIISRHHPADLMPCRAVLPMHRPLSNSCETESLCVSVVPLFRKAPRLGPTSVPHAPSTSQETKCSKGYACRFRTHAAVLLGPFRGIRS